MQYAYILALGVTVRALRVCLGNIILSLASRAIYQGTMIFFVFVVAAGHMWSLDGRSYDYSIAGREQTGSSCAFAHTLQLRHGDVHCTARSALCDDLC